MPWTSEATGIEAAMMATSATEEEFLQVLDEMNRICGAESEAEGGSALASVEDVDGLQMTSEVTSNRSLPGLGFTEEEEEDDDDEEDHRDKGPSISDVQQCSISLPIKFLDSESLFLQMFWCIRSEANLDNKNYLI